MVRLAKEVFIALTILLIGALGLTFLEEDSHILIIIMSISIFGYASFKLYPYIASNSWKRTNAIIIDIKEDSIKVAETGYLWTTYFFPVMHYKYSIEGVEYTSNQIAFNAEDLWWFPDDLWGGEKPLDSKFWYKWREGGTIEVYYNPKNIGESVVLRKLSPKRRSHYIAMYVAAFLLVIVWYFVFRYMTA